MERRTLRKIHAIFLITLNQNLITAGKHMEEKTETKMSFSIKLCSDKTAFEVRPQKRASVRMAEAKLLLENTVGYDIVVDTPHIMILRRGDAEITLSSDGRMLIKKVKDEKEACLIALDIFGIVFQ